MTILQTSSLEPKSPKTPLAHYKFSTKRDLTVPDQQTEGPIPEVIAYKGRGFKKKQLKFEQKNRRIVEQIKKDGFTPLDFGLWRQIEESKEQDGVEPEKVVQEGGRDGYECGRNSEEESIRPQDKENDELQRSKLNTNRDIKQIYSINAMIKDIGAEEDSKNQSDSDFKNLNLPHIPEPQRRNHKP